MTDKHAIAHVVFAQHREIVVDHLSRPQTVCTNSAATMTALVESNYLVFAPHKFIGNEIPAVHIA